jgi:3-methylfumaryl-CoA hydratase
MPAVNLARFAFRAVTPIFDNGPFRIFGCRADDGKTIHLWARPSDGAVAMDTTATLA